MNTHPATYQTVPYPKIRRALAVMVGSAQRKHIIHGLLEVDVTRPRQYMRQHKASTGETFSFTAFIIACLARAVAEHPYLHACRKGKKHLALFEHVDVATAVEREMGAQKQPIIYIIRAADTKTLAEIHHEIRTAQAGKIANLWTGFAKFQWFTVVPLLLFRLLWPLFWRLRDTNPQVQKKYGGTVGVSAVGMFGKGGGWGIPISYHTLDLTLGGIAKKPGVVDGTIAIREYLDLTLSINHDVVDGASAARFAARLQDLVESGAGLIAEDVALARA
ncbi:MAG: hypothetical protein OJF49_001202 [Ktedonobacterales bacterium]|jgi:pyruvate/2-oxoglutarate dehydrogenase complex dihydrolipoamide acyltransferase (E2) component|nr:MAG: hypothetical protein OJF49_001202 [Ktedonobacterales bacterium]